MTIMAETPDTMTEIRIGQQETARALVELLGLDLPPVSWDIGALEWRRGQLTGSLRRLATSETFDVAAQEVALNEWVTHFGVTAVPRWPVQYEPTRSERSLMIEFSFHDVTVTIYAAVPARPAEVEPEAPGGVA